MIATNNLQNDFIANVLYHIDRRKKSQAELAESAGMSRPYLNSLLQGKSSPSLEVCQRIAEALNIDGAKLFKKRA